MVRRLGPGVPLVALAHLDPAFAKYQLLLVPGVVPASQRGLPLRVGLRRRQPRAGLGGARGVRHRRRPGPRLPQPGVRQAAGELHLVGEPRGRRRLQPVRRRVPGAGQHRPDRPVPSPSVAGSSSPTPPAGWPSTRSPWPPSPRSSTFRPASHARPGPQVPRAFRPDPPGHGHPGGLGRRRRLLLRQARRPRRARGAGQGPVDGRRHPAGGRRGHRRGGDRSCRDGREGVRAAAPRVGGPGAPRRAWSAANPAIGGVLLGVVGVEHLTKLLAKLFDEGEFLSPYGLRALSAFHRDHPTSSRSTASGPASTTSRPSRPPGCSAGTPTGVAHLVPAQLPADQRPRALPPVLRRRAHRRVPDGAPVAPSTRSPPTCAGGWSTCSSSGRTVGDPARGRPPPARPRLERQPGLQRVLPRRRRGRARASHQTGWTGLVADLIRGRPSADGVYAIGAWAGSSIGHGRDRRRGRPGQVRPQPLPARGDPEPWRDQLRVVVAEGMLLCLFDDAGAETRVALPEYDAGVWHGFVEGVGAGQAYGYRATGPWDPARGVRCNPAKLLLDPYAGHDWAGAVRAGGPGPRRRRS